MRTVYVCFPTVMDVKKFVENISPLEGNFDLIEGMYVIDAKSLMGIFAMNLSKPIKLRIEKDTEVAMRAIESFIVEEVSDETSDDSLSIRQTAKLGRIL